MVEALQSKVGDNPAIIRDFLIQLFGALNESGLTWAVMRGWERLPDWTRYDVDILVARGDEKNAVGVVKRAAKETGWHVYGILRMGAMHSVWMLKQGSVGHDYLRIDIETGNRYRGIEIHESQKYLKDRIWDEKRKLWRMPDGYAGAAVLLKELAVKGRVDSLRRQEQVTQGLGDPLFKAIVVDALCDEALSEKLLSNLQNRDWSGVVRLSAPARKRLFRKTPMNALRMAAYAAETAFGLFKPFMRCLIVLVGPDGCGKTTVANAIAARFDGRPFQGMLRIHMLFGVPRMRTLKAAVYRCVGKTLPPQIEAAPGTRHVGMQKPHSMLRAMAYVTYYGLGMIFGRIRLLLWRTQGGLVIADRFFQDYYYMRGYMKCPKWYVRMMEFFAPTPDLIISLERPAEEIYAQKPELDVVEIKREQEAIRRYIGRRDNARIVDAGLGVETTIERVNMEIEKWIEDRGRRLVNGRDYRCLTVHGEQWAAYPVGMRFPASFSGCYPMRGGGKVSRILFVLNRVHLDWLVSRKRRAFGAKHLPSLKQDEQVAFFWPAASRSIGRFYGYRVEEGVVTEYWKLATSKEEQQALSREAENTTVAKELAKGAFRVPSCLGTETRDGVLIVRYEALPPDVRAVPLDAQWRNRIACARRIVADAGYQHGDFGWHNLKASGNELWILDWEEMSKELPRLTDEISFETMAAHYNEGRPLEEVVKALHKRYSGQGDEVLQAVSSMAKRRIAMGDALLKMWSRS